LRQLRFRVLAAENPEDVSSAREAALAFVAGRRVDELRTLSEEIFDELMADRIWSGTHALARLHLDAGQRVWLVTAAPVELGDVIARRLGLTGAIGTVAEIVDGVYSGRLVGEMMHGPAKAAAIIALAEREGLDLGRCAAYSDSVNDLPMLNAVGRPVAGNPDAALRRAARESGWEIRDFRTGRKAAKVAVPTALGVGVAAGAVAAAVALNRRGAFRMLRRHGSLEGARPVRHDL
jgi:HAD superfamily hydrolase (TIGR01490 family)